MDIASSISKAGLQCSPKQIQKYYDGTTVEVPAVVYLAVINGTFASSNDCQCIKAMQHYELVQRHKYCCDNYMTVSSCHSIPVRARSIGPIPFCF